MKIPVPDDFQYVLGQDFIVEYGKGGPNKHTRIFSNYAGTGNLFQNYVRGP